MKCPIHYFTARPTVNCKPLRLPPRPEGHRFIGLLPGGRDWAPFLTDMAQNHGDVVFFKYLCQPACLVSDPELMAEVLITRQSAFSKSNVLRVVLGSGLVTSEGELWRSERRLILEAFHRACLPEYSRVAIRHTERTLAQWRPGETRDVYRNMTALTVGVAAEAFFGAELGAERNTLLDALQVAFDAFIVIASQAFLVPAWVPTPNNLRFRRAVRALHRIVDSIIQQRKSRAADGSSCPRDLLAILLEAQQSEPSVTDQLVHDEVMTFLLGGHETTANALAWTCYLVGQHPDVQTRMAAEARDLLAGEIPSFEHLPSLSYTEKVMKESLRLYPPGWYMTRKALEDLELGGYRIPKGTTMVMNLWGLHRDSRYYADPESFNPDRWTPEFTRSLPPLAYMPFGAGPRRCIGASFAQMEMLTVLAGMAQRFQWDLLPDQVVTPVAATTLRPLEGIKVVLRERNQEAGAAAFREPVSVEQCQYPAGRLSETVRNGRSSIHSDHSGNRGAALLGRSEWATTG